MECQESSDFHSDYFTFLSHLRSLRVKMGYGVLEVSGK